MGGVVVLLCSNCIISITNTNFIHCNKFYIVHYYVGNSLLNVRHCGGMIEYDYQYVPMKHIHFFPPWCVACSTFNKLLVRQLYFECLIF